jgi:hypothetical protein
MQPFGTKRQGLLALLFEYSYSSQDDTNVSIGVNA